MAVAHTLSPKTTSPIPFRYGSISCHQNALFLIPPTNQLKELEKDLSEYICRLTIPNHFFDVFSKNIRTYNLWLEITKKDLEIRRSESKTLMQAPHYIWEEISQIDLQGNITLDLRRIVEKNLNDLPPLKPE